MGCQAEEPGTKLQKKAADNQPKIVPKSIKFDPQNVPKFAEPLGVLDPQLLILQSLQSCRLQFAASMAAFSRIFDPLGRPGPEKSAARWSRLAC